MIYADNAATTKMSDVAFEKMLPFLREQYGNASSQYSLGSKARRAIARSRQQVAVAIGADPSEITFTSGGSETNSWVLRGLIETYRNGAVHIITSAIEHHSVLNACHAFEQCGVEVTYLPVDRNGCVSVDDVRSAIKPTTKLVSIMFANNEIGTIQPIEEMGKLLKERGILFHTDAVQAVGHIPINVHGLQVDFLTASAHKFNGAKGTGILYKRSDLKLPPLIFGGEQEQGLRAGTENVAGIVALGFALEESVAGFTEERERLYDLVQITIKRLKEAIPKISINGEDAIRLPGILNVTFPYISGEIMMNLLDMKGICVSTSSACNSGKDIPSHVLLALGLTEQQAKSSIRISYGRYNNLDEVEKIVAAVSSAYSKIVTNH
ncbi:MAG TPA: cysteine desulfurase NifS [Clostridiales bacterium]|nr:cysteine desulfurase NifS [Clostridiales bacterium]